MPHPVQVPLIIRFWSVVVVPVIDTVPGKDAVMPDLPIVIPVACDAPIVIVPVASRVLFESPVMLVPLNTREANATETPTVSATMPTDAASVMICLFKFLGES
jgi:hypothetical protein